jgi:hypothetical protein
MERIINFITITSKRCICAVGSYLPMFSHWQGKLTILATAQFLNRSRIRGLVIQGEEEIRWTQRTQSIEEAYV